MKKSLFMASKLGEIIDALQLYPKCFDHPGWPPLAH